MNDKEFYIAKWHELIEQNEAELKKKLTDDEISALAVCLEDCWDGFTKIFGNYMKTISKPVSGDDDAQVFLDNFCDMKFEFDHIKNHILDAEKGIFELWQIFEGKYK